MSRRPELRLSAAERKAYQEEGFFLRHGVFDAVELDDLRAAAERAAAAASVAGRAPDDDYRIDGNRYLEAGGSTVQLEHRDGSTTVRVVEPFHHFDPRFDLLLDDPRIAEPMRDLVGSDLIALFTDKLNLKRPREGSAFRWHQDSPYWVFDCGHVETLVNVMLLLDDASPENGCLHVVRGSHRRGILPGLEGQGALGALFTDPRFFDEDDAVAAEGRAGTLLFFHPHTVHGSKPNLSDLARRALVLTYQPAGHRTFKKDVVRDVRD
ncbi:L-proline trans-4-hydroxylase [Myxococcaceae bacterium]|jgi:ectoine hydroxylase-related dioxygenase (phytanoyl-CoA dioxygenase family)|nr:L-proline trans-4-hydroxylase [Myxococcaceae bacterium]